MSSDGWKRVQLGDILTLHYGKALVSHQRTPGVIPVYSSSGISGWHDKPLVNDKGIIIGRKGNVGTVYYCDVPFYCIDTAYYV
ncbi:MAG: restriction endonuclease subunit S, partial [Caldisericales bacterium]|nr:restriction endonuclease subunit S [Caldisericales bacterium]